MYVYHFLHISITSFHKKKRLFFFGIGIEVTHNKLMINPLKIVLTINLIKVNFKCIKIPYPSSGIF